MIVIRTERHRAGLIVDSVSDVLRTRAENIEPPPDLTEATSRLVRGVINLEDTRRMVLLLDPTEVLTLAATGHSSLGIATVYRNIKSLLEEGWLTPVELPGEVTHYELAGKEHHHHFHCRTCGKVYELNACLPNVQKLAPQGFQVAGHDLLLYGACRECSPA